MTDYFLIATRHVGHARARDRAARRARDEEGGRAGAPRRGRGAGPVGAARLRRRGRARVPPDAAQFYQLERLWGDARTSRSNSPPPPAEASRVAWAPSRRRAGRPRGSSPLCSSPWPAPARRAGRGAAVFRAEPGAVRPPRLAGARDRALPRALLPGRARGRGDAARMAERSYARLSRLLRHQFREKKPLILFASRGDFAQSNVFGDLGEGTGGVTDPLRQRMAQPFTGDYRSFEHVLMHEMVHQFQFDIFSRGKAGANLQRLSQVNPPLWFMEGMAEFLSLGYEHPQTDAWVRDAAVNGGLPSVKQMTRAPRPVLPVPLRLRALAVRRGALGRPGGRRDHERSCRRSASSARSARAGRLARGAGDEWREAMQRRTCREAARWSGRARFAQPLLTQRRTGGIGRRVHRAGALARRPVRRVHLVRQLPARRGLPRPVPGRRAHRQAHRASSRAPPTRTPRSCGSSTRSRASRPTARRSPTRRSGAASDVLYLLDVRRREPRPCGSTCRSSRCSAPPGRPTGGGSSSAATPAASPTCTWSAATARAPPLTRDRYGDMQPAWSPTGARSPSRATAAPTSTCCGSARWTIALCDVATGAVTELPDRRGSTSTRSGRPTGARSPT
jgi:hypothetical protein